MRKKEIKPALPARAAAWAVAFLLTITLTVTALGGPAAANRILTDETLHVRTATDESVIREQMEKVSGTVRELSEDYSFSADAVISAMNRDSFVEINRKTAEWWTGIVSNGLMDEIPAWNADEEVLGAISDTLKPIPGQEETEREETVKEIATEIEKAVGRTVMPLRKALVTLAVGYASRKTDLPGLIRLASEIPLFAAAGSLFLAGLIAFLLGKKIRCSLKYYGAAFAGAGLSGLTGMILIRSADFGSMLRVTSQGLDRQLQAMMKTAAAETWAAAAGLLLAGIIFLACYNRNPDRKHLRGGAHEKKKNAASDYIPENS